jgi:hypothetical protein
MIELGATVAGQEAPALDSVDVTARSLPTRNGNDSTGESNTVTETPNARVQ